MRILNFTVLRGVSWTAGTFAAGLMIRLVANVVLARLLAPDLFGIMVIVNSIRTGVDLISNVGIGQNIVQSKNGEDPDFYNTAWSLGLIRGLMLWAVCVAGALPLAHLYNAPIIASVLPIASFYFVLASMASLSEPLLSKRLQFARVNTFQFLLECVAAATHIVAAYLNPTIWALVVGSLAAVAVRAVGTYVLLQDVRHKFMIVGQYVREIVVFGKWIFLSSIIYFFSMNFDRLFLGKNVPFEVLGVYGIARSLFEMLGALAQRLGGIVIFPLIASSDRVKVLDLRAQLAPIRLKFFLVGAIGLSLLAAFSDLVVIILYDQRYHAATWMLSALVIGAWFSTLCNINEATLLGLGKPAFSAIANGCKLTWLVIGLPLAFAGYGVAGAICIVASADIPRYLAILGGQKRKHFAFAWQDLIATIVMLVLTVLWQWVRWQLGFGTSFDNLMAPS